MQDGPGRSDPLRGRGIPRLPACPGEQRCSRFARRQMVRMAHKALDQGAPLTAEDFAFHIFNCGLRTISRDLKALAAQGVAVPLCSQQKDVGRALTHRVQAVELYLKRYTFTQIRQRIHHSLPAIANYVITFAVVVARTRDGHSVEDRVPDADFARPGAPVSSAVRAVQHARVPRAHQRDHRHRQGTGLPPRPTERRAWVIQQEKKGGEAMIRPRQHHREVQYRPQAAKTLRQALIGFITREFPPGRSLGDRVVRGQAAGAGGCLSHPSRTPATRADGVAGGCY
ncbi:MAG TPA: DUF1670 domain-containing protein [Anaerolineae bacterium]|nr:DUF1670 domain-containing protein [Anaerolineae bacterium]